MSSHEEKVDTGKVPHAEVGSSTNLVIMGTIADTTWRMFTPVIVLLVVGFWLDNKFDTKPWLVLTGVIIGFGAAVGLIWLQYRQVTKSIGKKSSE